jgi:hypothetical protein
MRRSYWLLLLALIVLAVRVYTAYSESKAVIVPLAEVPEAFVKKAKDTLPEVKFDHARKLPNGNYEIRGKLKNGKVREVELNASGEVVEIE